MFNRWLYAAVVVVVCACGNPPIVPMSSGSLAVSRDDALLYIADADHDRLTILDAKTGGVVLHVPVGVRPERVAVAPDGTVFVSNRGSRSVTQLTRDGLVRGTVEVGAEPIGLSFSRDGKRLFVANSTSGTVSELDAQALTVRRTLEVGGTPWGIAPHPGGEQLYVTDFLGGQLKVVPLMGGRVESTRLEQPPGAWCPEGRGGEGTRQPAQAADVVVSPEGDRIFVAHVQSRTQPAFNGTGGGSLAFAVAPALSTVDARSNLTLQEQPRDFNRGLDPQANPDFPASLLATQLDEQCSTRGGGMDAPSSLVVDGSGEWIFVADHNSNAVAVVSATRRFDERFESPERGIYGVVRVGARPTGIAVAGDLKSAWVHNSLDYSVSKIELRDGTLRETQVFAFSQSELPPAVERGRRLFYSAVDPRISQPQLGGLSCSSCHPEGRTDGLNWALPQATTTTRWDSTVLPGRNTPALWQLADTAPYAWEGDQPDLPTFNAHMVNQMGGGGLSRVELLDVSAFLGTLQAPDNPNPTATHGATVFAQHCASCHAGEALTDGLKHAVGGTLLDTPSLRAVFATGPWLHNGSARTLRDALWHAGGAPSSLTSTDAQALEQYLRAR